MIQHNRKFSISLLLLFMSQICTTIPRSNHTSVRQLQGRKVKDGIPLKLKKAFPNVISSTTVPEFPSPVTPVPVAPIPVCPPSSPSHPCVPPVDPPCLPPPAYPFYELPPSNLQGERGSGVLPSFPFL